MGLAGILLLLQILIAIGSGESCSAEELERCLVVLQSAAKSDDLALATTRHELHTVCRKLQRGVKCIDEHSSRCFNSAELNVFDSVVNGSRHVIEGICVEEAIQEEYLRHAPCFKNISTDLKKCAAKYRKVAIISQELKEEKDPALKSFCCALRDFILCKNEHALRDCGPDASLFLQKHVDKMSGSLINEHCVVYTYGLGSCSSTGHKLKVLKTFTAYISLVFCFIICIMS
ncbi:hypothetical protein JTE90_016841 [Oedothorax gibbosus]|uniref:Uncharacterized protein n=1 Tax=Oedothorax gibbosus TaxID=931172 RepID=A0AAV6VZ84_9ARAC|nr:hypothetical protein JTE90_016841 [Oedothorax gibbosus]